MIDWWHVLTISNKCSTDESAERPTGQEPLHFHVSTLDNCAANCSRTLHWVRDVTDAAAWCNWLLLPPRQYTFTAFSATREKERFQLKYWDEKLQSHLHGAEQLLFLFIDYTMAARTKHSQTVFCCKWEDVNHWRSPAGLLSASVLKIFS